MHADSEYGIFKNTLEMRSAEHVRTKASQLAFVRPRPKGSCNLFIMHSILTFPQ